MADMFSSTLIPRLEARWDGLARSLELKFEIIMR
jgi:hypothetical protein